MGNTAEDDLRVGDDERRAVDARLHAAVGAGQLDLLEYDERTRAVWAARTRGELAAVVRDLPPVVPVAPTASSLSVPALGVAPAAARRRRLRVVGLAVVAAFLFGGLGIGGGDDLPERTVVVQPEDVRVEVPEGEVTVVVPDGVTAQVEGALGREVECEDACSRPGRTVRVVVLEGRGEVEVETVEEHD